MADNHDEFKRPIRVVVFTSGPVLQRGSLQFLDRLEQHPQIELLACLAQSKQCARRAAYVELWRRRGVLAVPILLAEWVNAAWCFFRYFRRERELQRRLAALADRIYFVPDIHAPAVLDRVRELVPDLGLIYGSPILRPALFEIPALGTLGIHHGKAPEYRGKKTMFWAMYNGEQAAGVTIQKVNVGLDTGDIVKQGEVPIGRRSPRSVWRELEALGLDLYLQAILEVKQGTALHSPQVGKRGTLYRDPKLRDILRFWMRHFQRRLNL